MAQCTGLVEGVYTYYVFVKGDNVQAVVPVTVAVYNRMWAIEPDWLFLLGCMLTNLCDLHS